MAEEIKNEGAHPKTEEKPLDKMTAPELKEIAATIPGVTGVTAMKKEELLALIKKHRGIEDDTHAKKAEAAKKRLKNKLVDLRALKAAAREEKDNKKVDVLRRRINRLKKKTRRAG
jgi:cell division protein FtsX